MQNGIQPDEITCLERSACMAEALFENTVDILWEGDLILYGPDRFIDRQHQYPVGHKPRHIVN
ncbi:hypothetical protein D3C75_714450 [compost metagenome]